MDALLAETDACLAGTFSPHPEWSDVLHAWHGLPIRASLDEEALHRIARHAHNLGHAAGLVRALEAAAIPAAVLKGPLLQEQLYGDRALRAYSDIDLVVTRDTFRAARKVLQGLGWRSVTPAWARPIHFHEVFRHPGIATPVELHRALVDPANLYRLPGDDLVRRSVPVSTPAGPLPSLQAADLLVYLCLHVAKHGFLNEVALAEGRDASWFLHPSPGNRLVWLLDVALLLETGISATATDLRDWNVEAPVACTLTLVAKLLPSSRAHDALNQLDLASWTPRTPSKAELRLLARMDRGDAVRTSTGPEIRPARLAQLPALFFPSNDELCAFHRVAKAGLSTRMRHIGVMAKRLLVQ